MISAFGVDHGGISKSYNKIAGRLAAAAAKGDPYAKERIATGIRSRPINENMKISAKNSGRWRTPNKRKRAKVADAVAGGMRSSGRQHAVSARKLVPAKTPGGIGRMEEQAAARIKANKPMSTGHKVLIGTAGAAGVGAGLGGNEVLQRRKAMTNG